MRTPKWWWALLLVMAIGTPLWAGEEAEALYQKGMDSFLQGDYDKAILYTAKSLQVEPSFKKAQDFLSVLVVEKEQGTQTEIWLSDRPRPSASTQAVPTPDLSDIRKDIQGLGERVTVLEKKNQVRVLERRVQVIAEMMRKASKDNADEWKAAQSQTLERIEKLNKGQGSLGLSLFWLFVLVGLSLILSIWNLIRKKPSAPRLDIERN